MVNEKFHSITVSRDTRGAVTTRVYHGNRAEMEALAAEHHIGETEESGRLKELRLHPTDDGVWECEFKYDAPDDWESIIVPPRDWGKKSCHLRGGTLSRPLEAHPRYRTRWNHGLYAAPGTTALPAWCNTATDTLIPAGDADRYCWCRNPAEAPLDAEGRWRLLAAPSKPGLDSYDTATYTVIETARFRSASRAGRMVADTLNRIGSPANTFGISGGSWKCGDAEVSWKDDCWIARLTWTRSADGSGWDSDLYGEN